MISTTNEVSLKPGKVVDIQDAKTLILIHEEGEKQKAQMALGYPYHPHIGDILLTLCQKEACYVVGVLKGSGPTTFYAPGNLNIHAPNGSIEILAQTRIKTQAPDITLRGHRLNFFAKTLNEKFENALRWVKNTFHLKTGRLRAVSETTVQIKGKHVIHKAKGEMKIDGEHIRLG